MAVSRIGTRGNVFPAVVAALIVAVVAWNVWALVAGPRGYATWAQVIASNLEPLRHGAVLAFYRGAWTDSTVLQAVLVLVLGVILPIILAFKLQDNRIFRLDPEVRTLITPQEAVGVERIRRLELEDRGLTVVVEYEATDQRRAEVTLAEAHGVTSAQWPAVRELAALTGRPLDPSRTRALEQLRVRNARETAERLGIVWRDQYESPHATGFFEDVEYALESHLIDQEEQA